MIELIARVGNLRVGTTGERDAITGDALYEGLHFYNTTLDALQQYDGSGWVRVIGNAAFTALTYTGIYSAGSPAPRVTAMNGMYLLEGVVLSTTATFGANTAYTIGSIPSAKAPVSTRTFPIMVNNVFGWVSVDSSGNISITSSVGFTGVLIAHINGALWPDKTL